MTAIKDALTKAGVDTAAAELRTRAREALQFNRGNVGAAAEKLTNMLMKRRDLVGSLALQYLQTLAADPDVTAAIAVQEKRPRDVKVKSHARHRRRTTAEKDAALRVAGAEVAALRGVFDHRVNGRPIGDLAWGELGAMIDDNAGDASAFLRLGTEATANALLLLKVQQFAQVADHSTKVKQVLSASQLQKLMDESAAEAPRWVQAGMAKYARAVSRNDMKEIAA